MPADRARIAVIEDDASVLDAITMLLETEGWDVEPYASGKQFLSTLERTPPPACIVLDLLLPGMNGADVLSGLDGVDVPTIVLTAYPSSLVAKQAQELGAKAILTKPVQPDRLIETLREYLDGR